MTAATHRLPDELGAAEVEITDAHIHGEEWSMAEHATAVPAAPWPYGGDADEHDPLTALRIAVTDSHPRCRYHVAFDRDSEARPTDEEAAMLASYLDLRLTWYNTSYRQRMAARPLDTDGSINTVIFHKWGRDDWGYRRASFTGGLMWTVAGPCRREHNTLGLTGRDVQPHSLIMLLDRIRQHGSDEPNAEWEAWKAARPNIFPKGQETHVSR